MKVIYTHCASAANIGGYDFMTGMNRTWDNKAIWFKIIEDVGNDHITRIGWIPRPENQRDCYGKMLECKESNGSICIRTSTITAIQPYYDEKRISKSDAMDIVVGLLSLISLDIFSEVSE